MNLKQRFQTAVKILTGTNLSNSVGSVLRNYYNQEDYRDASLKGITYKAIDKIGQSLSVYEPLVEKKGGDIYENHPLYKLFQDPNPRMSGSDFIHLYGMLYEIYGETFWYMARGENTNKIKELYLLNPIQVEIKVNQGELVGYVLHKANGEQVPFTLEEIYHDKRPNPFNEWRGMSIIERASTYIGIEITTSSFTLNYLKNNASPSGIVSLPNMDRDGFHKFTTLWRESYEGPENAGKTAFIRGGEASFKAVGATLKDIDQKVTRDMAKEDVLMMLEVPKALLGMVDQNGLGRANVETVHYIYTKEKIDPLMTRLDRIYLTILKSQPQQDLAVGVTHKSPIPEDKDWNLSRQEKGTNVWLTVDEARAIDGLPELPDGMGKTIIPRNATNNVPPAKSKRVVLKRMTKSDEVKKLNQEQEEFRSNLVKTNDIYATKLKTTITKFVNSQEDLVIGKINASSKAYEEWLFNIKEESEALATLLIPIMIELIETQGEDVANFITGELLTISPEMRKLVETNIKQISGVFNQDTIVALEKTLSEGQAAGESLVKLKKRVESVFIEAKGFRAERIARTESLKASNMTAEEVYKQNGFTTVKWFANPGACEFCRVLDGRVKAIGGDFLKLGDVFEGDKGGQMRIEYSNIPTPPIHPNCTCSLVPEE